MVADHVTSKSQATGRTVRSRNADATRASFLKEGEKLFAQFGFDGVSLEQLASQVGGNKTLVSYHFGSKKGLYSAVIGTIVSDVMTSISERLHRTDDPVKAFAAYIEALVFSFADRPAFCAILMRGYIAGTIGRHDDIFGHLVKLFRLTDELYRDGVAQDKFKILDSHLLHFSIMGPIIHFIVSQGFRHDSLAVLAPEISIPSLEAFAAHHVRMTLDGLVQEA